MKNKKSPDISDLLSRIPTGERTAEARAFLSELDLADRIGAQISGGGVLSDLLDAADIPSRTDIVEMLDERFRVLEENLLDAIAKRLG